MVVAAAPSEEEEDGVERILVAIEWDEAADVVVATVVELERAFTLNLKPLVAK